MLVALHVVGVAVTPSNAIVLVPWVAPKLDPAMVTDVPTTPVAGVTFVMAGPGVPTVNVEPLLVCPATPTTTGPVVAPTGTVVTMLVGVQIVGVAAVPLNVSVLGIGSVVVVRMASVAVNARFQICSRLIGKPAG